MSRKNTRHINPLQQLPRFVRAAVYNRLTIRHYRFFKERIIWHGPRYKILMNGSPSNMAQTLKRNHRYDNKPRTPFYKSLHRDRRKLKRFVERVRWAQEHPQDPIDVFFKTLREKFDPEEFKRQILNVPHPVHPVFPSGQLTYNELPKITEKYRIPVLMDPDIHRFMFEPMAAERIEHINSLKAEMERQRFRDDLDLILDSSPIMRISMDQLDKIKLPDKLVPPVLTFYDGDAPTEEK